MLHQIEQCIERLWCERNRSVVLGHQQAPVGIQAKIAEFINLGSWIGHFDFISSQKFSEHPKDFPA